MFDGAMPNGWGDGTWIEHEAAQIGWTDQGGVLVGPPVDTTVDLVKLKAGLSSRIDDDAERVRLRYITPGAGMAMTYQEKFAQAQAVSALGEQAANAMSQAERELQFPTLSASVGLEAATLWGCAELVLEKYAQFATLSMTIERLRLSGKAAVKAATTEAEARAAYDAVIWP
jgi:hypothetical protein